MFIKTVEYDCNPANDTHDADNATKNWVYQMIEPPYPNMFVVMSKGGSLVSKPVVSLVLYDRITPPSPGINESKPDGKEQKLGCAVFSKDIVELAEEEHIITPVGVYQPRDFIENLIKDGTRVRK